MFATAFCIGFLSLNSGTLSGPWTIYLSTAGWLLVLAGVIVEITAFAALKRAGTAVSPTVDAIRLVTSGPYAMMRHPIYFGNVAILIGLGMAFGAPSLLIAGPLSGIIVHFFSVLPEERRMAQKFGGDWQCYARCTSRWFFF